jgi:hypothetical protein
MVGGAAAECAERGIPVLSIHDGLAVREGDKETVAEIVARHWTSVTENAPKMKVAGRGRLYSVHEGTLVFEEAPAAADSIAA